MWNAPWQHQHSHYVPADALVSSYQLGGICPWFDLIWFVNCVLLVVQAVDDCATRGRLGWLVHCECVRPDSLKCCSCVGRKKCLQLWETGICVMWRSFVRGSGERNVHCDGGVSMCGCAQQCCAQEKKKKLHCDRQVFFTSVTRCCSFFFFFFAVGFISVLSVNLNRGPYPIFFFFLGCWFIFGSSCFIKESWFAAFVTIVAA